MESGAFMRDHQASEEASNAIDEFGLPALAAADIPAQTATKIFCNNFEDAEDSKNISNRKRDARNTISNPKKEQQMK